MNQVARCSVPGRDVTIQRFWIRDLIQIQTESFRFNFIGPIRCFAWDYNSTQGSIQTDLPT